MAGASVRINGIGEVKKMFTSMAAKAKDLTPAMKVCGERMITSFEENFRQGGRPSKWPESQRVKTKGGKTLILSGRLKNSITYKAEKQRLIVGTNVKYAAAHQFGFKGKVRQRVRAHKRRIDKAFGKPIDATTVNVKGFSRTLNQNIPARPYIVVQESDQAYFEKMIMKHVIGGN